MQIIEDDPNTRPAGHYGKALAKIFKCAIVHIAMLTKRKKERAAGKVRIHEKDTGSAEVQISLLTKQIGELAKHLKKHNKDKHSRRGLLQMVADRRAHLKYLEGKNKRRYSTLIKKLDLKK